MKGGTQQWAGKVENSSSMKAHLSCGLYTELEGRLAHSLNCPKSRVSFLGQLAQNSAPSLYAVEGQQGMEQSHVQGHMKIAHVQEHVRVEILLEKAREGHN